MRKMLLLSLLFLTVSTAFSGCATNRVTLHPIEGTDILMVKAGEQLTAPKDGAFLSKVYIDEVMKAQVK